MKKRTGAIAICLVFAGFGGAFAACSADDSNGGAPDGSTDDVTIGADGSSDGASTSDASSADAAANDGAITEAGTRSDGGPCTPHIGGPFECGLPACTDSTSQYCIYGAVPNTCEPLPPECQCEETFNCACLVANLICDDGGAKAVCLPHNEAGAAEAADASTSTYFWIDAHDCVVK